MSIKGSQIVAALVVGLGATLSAGSFATPFGSLDTGVAHAQYYRHGNVTMSPSMVRTPFGAARSGTAWAAPNPPRLPGYQYGAVKLSPNAVRIPAGVMSNRCYRIPAGIRCN